MPLNKTDAMDISRWLEQNVGAPLLMLHDRIYKATDGRIGHTIPGGPSNLILHTTARNRAEARQYPSYARDGDDYLVVASKGGDPKAPVGPKRFGVTAKPVPPDVATDTRGCADAYVVRRAHGCSPVLLADGYNNRALGECRGAPTRPAPGLERKDAWLRQRSLLAARSRACRKMSSSICAVSLPVNVFCWLGW
jgi:hypothetical protein